MHNQGVHRRSPRLITPECLIERIIYNDCIFQLLEDLLLLKFDKKQSKQHTDNLLNASKKFQNLKKSKYYCLLNEDHSIKYYRYANFRRNLNSLLSHPEKQLSLYLRRCDLVHEVSALGSVHTLDLCLCKNVVDVSALGNVHRLFFIACEGLTDVSALSNVRVLSLSGCNGITYVSALGNVMLLQLYFFMHVTDISALGNVRILDVRYCT
jgi:hypothetical protein